MKFDIKFSSKNMATIEMKQIVKVASRIWQKTHTLLFFVILIIFIVIGGYIWKQSLYSGEWSNEKKQEYLNTQNKEVIFNGEDFQKVLNDISSREEEYSKTYQPIKDVFKPYN